MQFIHLDSIDDERVSAYTNLTEIQLRNKLEPSKGLFIAESPKVIDRALTTDREPISLLVEEPWIGGMSETFARIDQRWGTDIPVYVASPEQLKQLTGYRLHRGALAAMKRWPLPSVEEVCRGARRIAVMENIVDHTNVGALMRSAAALNVDAVLVTPSCGDPLYRRGRGVDVPVADLQRLLDRALCVLRRNLERAEPYLRNHRMRLVVQRQLRSLGTPLLPPRRVITHHMPRFPTDSRRTIAAARHPTAPHLRTSTHGNTRPCMRKRHRSSLAHPRSGTARKRPPQSRPGPAIWDDLRAQHCLLACRFAFAGIITIVCDASSAISQETMVMAIQSTITLNNGTVIPQIGLGVFRTPDGDTTVNAVQAALENGYRHIDTAMIYRNETSVGEGIRRSGVPRGDLFVTTKLWNDDIRAHRGKEAFQESLDRLGMDYVDLYLIHWPADVWQQAWDDLQEIYASGRAKAIGVSNFQPHHLADLLKNSDVTPAVDQIESSPQFTNQPLVDELSAKGIATEAYSPLGGTGGDLLAIPELAEIGAKYGKSAAQTVIRWHIQRGVVVLPKSTHADRIRQNIDVFDFVLSDDDMAAISAMDTGKRNSADPDNFDF